MEDKGQSISISTLCVQFDSVYGDVDKSTVKLMAMIDKYAGKSIDIVVLPECCLTGYAFPDRQSMVHLAEVIGKGRQFDVCKQIALITNAYVALGYIELEDYSEGSPS